MAINTLFPQDTSAVIAAADRVRTQAAQDVRVEGIVLKSLGTYRDGRDYYLGVLPGLSTGGRRLGLATLLSTARDANGQLGVRVGQPDAALLRSFGFATAGFESLCEGAATAVNPTFFNRFDGLLADPAPISPTPQAAPVSGTPLTAAEHALDADLHDPAFLLNCKSVAAQVGPMHRGVLLGTAPQQYDIAVGLTSSGAIEILDLAPPSIGRWIARQTDLKGLLAEGFDGPWLTRIVEHNAQLIGVGGRLAFY